MKKFTKILLSALVLLLLVISVTSAAPIQPENATFEINQAFSQYDVYRDGVINITDIAFMQSFMYTEFGDFMSAPLFDPYVVAIVDFNQDGIVDIDDMNEVAIRYDCIVSQPCYW